MNERNGPLAEHAADVSLACACAERDAAAVRALDEIVRDRAAWAAARLGRPAAFADDVAQTVRERLLTGEDPKIATYVGRAPLRSFVGTAAMRVALDMCRGAAERGHDPLDSSAGPVVREPELDYLRERYRAQFQDALREALAALSQKDRALLRLHLGEQLGIDKLATLYAVGRSTAHRWLGDARERLAAATRAALCRRLRLTPSEYESLAALVKSDITVSIVRLLGDPA